MPVTVTRMVNPENLGTGEAVASLRFVAGQTRLFADERFQVGNSPTSARLELRDPGQRDPDRALRDVRAGAHRLRRVARR